jgi:hypothetical protein
MGSKFQKSYIFYLILYVFIFEYIITTAHTAFAKHDVVDNSLVSSVTYRFPWKNGVQWRWWNSWHDETSTHAGLDIGTNSSNRSDREVLVSATGILRHICVGQYFYEVTIEDADGVILTYGHLDKDYISEYSLPSSGTVVQQGFVLGALRPGTWGGGCGSTQQTPSNSHIHWGLPKNKALVFDGWKIQHPDNYWECVDATLCSVGEKKGTGNFFASTNIPLSTNESYKGEFAGQNYQDVMIADTTQRVQVQIKNIGTKPWDENTKIYTLPLDQDSPFYHSSWLTPHRVASSGVVQPGEIGTFDFLIHAPTTPDDYRLEFAFVQEGITFFSQPANGSIYFLIRVWPPLSVAAHHNHVTAFEYLADQRIRYCEWNSNGVTPWTALDNTRTEYAVAGLISTSGDIHAFARGTTSALWHGQRVGATWADWENLEGRVFGSPVVVESTSGQMDVFVRGGSGIIYQRRWNGTVWEPWVSLGGATSFSPVVVAWGANRLELFIRGDDTALYHRSWDGTSWSEWVNLEGRLQDPPAVIVSTTGRIDVFVRGRTGIVYQRTKNGATWEPWADLGGFTDARPTAVSWGDGRIDLFVRGADSGLEHRIWYGSAWSTWENLGGRVVGAPVAASWGKQRMGVFVRGRNGDAYQLVWDGSQWKPWEMACTTALPRANSELYVPMVIR